MQDFGIVSVPVIVILCLLLGKAWKTADRLDNKWIPVVCGTFGGILGVVAMFIVDGFPANDVLTAIAYGIVSGFAATGVHQAVKQHVDSIKDDYRSAGGEM